ncbi:MAG: tetratricopeptide repeat protein [Spirochaetota bacterium]
MGSVVVRNLGGAPIEKAKVTFFIAEYMDNPKTCAIIPVLEPGMSAKAELFALFNKKMLDISEGTKVSGRVTVDYIQAEKPATAMATGTVRIYDRNASMWDDDRKAAAFVTSKDPTVLRFAKNVLAMTKGKGSKAVNANLLTAMALHEATRLFGLAYVTDPSNSYALTLENKTAVDYLQFPRQTLDYKSGNCSALSILYSALLESVGVETAFVTVPGHIFMAFSLGIGPESARKTFASPDDLILTRDAAWLPIETTSRNAGFQAAWKEAAKEWRENLAKKQAVLYPVHEAWALYEPVGFASDLSSIALPPEDRVVAAYLEELIGYIDAEISPQVAKLQAEITRSNGSPRSVNQLGVLYARYGLFDRASAQFTKALGEGDYAPALLNLGNIACIQHRFEEALSLFSRAERISPSDPAVHLAIARANHDLENYGMAKAAYEKLKTLDPSLAGQFGYLALKGEEGIRAADISGVKDLVVWGEE